MQEPAILGDKKVGAGGESKIQIQHMMLRSAKVEEEPKNSERRHHKCIYFLPNASCFLTTAADLANCGASQPGVTKKIRSQSHASRPAGTNGLEYPTDRLGENTLSLSVS